MMSDPAFLRHLQEMDCDHITLKQQQAVRAHLKKSDKLDQMQAISRAGYGLYKFVIAVLDYCAVYREVSENFNISMFIYEIYDVSNLRRKYYELPVEEILDISLSKISLATSLKGTII